MLDILDKEKLENNNNNIPVGGVDQKERKDDGGPCFRFMKIFCMTFTVDPKNTKYDNRKFGLYLAMM